MNQLPVSEADLKRAVTDYLQYGKNQGKWLFFRLNAGSFFIQNTDGSPRRRVMGAEKGTADFVIFQGIEFNTYYQGKPYKPIIPQPGCRVTFLEIKSSAGKQTVEQKSFEEEVTKLHCRYEIIRDEAELDELLKC